MDYKKINKVVILLSVVIIILVIIISLFVGYYLFNKDSDNTVEILLDEVRISTDVYDISSAEQKVKDRRVFYSGIPDSEIKEGIAIQLRNPEENVDIYIQYTIVDDSGNMIHSTDLIIPGKYTIWFPAEDLSVGKHSISVTQQPLINVDNKWIKLLPATNNVNITIIE